MVSVPPLAGAPTMLVRVIHELIQRPPIAAADLPSI
jgi:hypothetical protein